MSCAVWRAGANSCNSVTLLLLTVVYGHLVTFIASLLGGSEMNVTRSFAAAATFAAVAVGAAATAWADQTMSGHYIRTETSQTGQSETDDWYATPRSDGCASLASTPGGPALSQARLVNGQWTLASAVHTLSCPDGTVVPSAVSAYYTWDPNTLAGTVQLTSQVPACGIPAGYQTTNFVQITQAP